MSRAPVKPRAQKAAAVIAVVPKRTPSKRAPKRAVAVEKNPVTSTSPPIYDKAFPTAMSSGPIHPDLTIVECLGRRYPPKPKDSREKMLASQRALHASLGTTTRDDIADAKDYAAENAKNRREAHVTTMYAFAVFGFLALVGIAVYLWGWK